MRIRSTVDQRALAVLAAALVVFGGGVAATSAGTNADEVVVYSARIEKLIKPMFDTFTAKTGIRVRYFTASEAELFERLRAEGPVRGHPLGSRAS